jgi:hypothetical protein
LVNEHFDSGRPSVLGNIKSQNAIISRNVIYNRTPFTAKDAKREGKDASSRDVISSRDAINGHDVCIAATPDDQIVT